MRCTPLLSAVLLLGAACSDDAPAVPPECSPLAASGCAVPWPSSIYLEQDPTTATGYRLAFPDGALPKNGDAIAIDPTRFNEHDGFSPASFAFITFEGGVDDSNLVGYDAIDDSVTDASPTVLIDMDTGERVHHFAEIDANAMEFEVDEQALYIRPAYRLTPGHRYAVGVRTSLQSAAGGDLPVPRAFDQVRRGHNSGHARYDAVDHEAIFAAFEAAGIDRDELVVAWDFVVASDDYLTSTMLAARDVALADIGDRAANVTYEVDVDDPEEDDDRIARRIVGRFKAPLLLTGTDDLAELARDAAGEPMVNGTMDARFAIMVPTCAAAARPVPILIFGHGFFGDNGEVQGDYMRRVADELCMVVMGTEWTGMSRRDVPGAALALNEASRLIGFGERIVQGIINHMVLTQLARGAFATELLADGGGSLVDPDDLQFYGISQGHVLGATFFAYDPVLDQAALAVGGTNWSLLFERSTNWPNFHLIIAGAYEGPLNTVMIESLMQLGLDPIENLHVSPRILGDGLPGTPPKQILMHMANGDSSVPNLASELHARTLGIPLMTPAVRSVWGVEEEAGPLASGLVIYDEHPTPLPPESNERNLNDNGTHTSARTQPAAVRQIQHFFATGEIVNECDGACDCAAGACD
jgi:hypothetical protein